MAESRRGGWEGERSAGEMWRRTVGAERRDGGGVRRIRFELFPGYDGMG